MDTTKFTYFVLLNPKQSSFSFLAQFVDQDGDNHEIIQSKDQFGNKTYRRFKWTQQNRTIIMRSFKAKISLVIKLIEGLSGLNKIEQLEFLISRIRSLSF
jgi:hypothetical protein